MTKDKTKFCFCARAIPPAVRWPRLSCVISRRSFRVYSAGLELGRQSFTIRVMEEIGVDMSDHRSKSLLSTWKSSFWISDHRSANRAEQNVHLSWYGASLAWPFEDPASAAAMRLKGWPSSARVRGQIDAKVRECY